MSYDPRTEATPVARNKQTLSAEQCRAINATLPPRLKCAVLHGRRGKAIVFVERPRNAGRAPKRGVYIPQPARVQKGLAKVSKHAKQQSRDGKFGNQGERTIDRKLAFLEESSRQALMIAVKRSLRRASRGLPYDMQWSKLQDSYRGAVQRAAAVMGMHRVLREVKS